MADDIDGTDIEEYDLMHSPMIYNEDAGIDECDLIDSPITNNDDRDIERYDFIVDLSIKNDDTDIEAYNLMDNPIVNNDDIDIEAHNLMDNPIINNDDTDIGEHDLIDNPTVKNDDTGIKLNHIDLIDSPITNNDDRDIERYDFIVDMSIKNDDTDIEAYDLMDNPIVNNDDIDIEAHNLMDNPIVNNDDANIGEHDLIDNLTVKNDGTDIEENDFMDNVTIKNDNVDIEEHDIMDNLAIRNMFPDLSVLKNEIPHYFEEDSSIKQEPEASSTFDPAVNNSSLLQNSEITLECANKSGVTTEQKALYSIKEHRTTTPSNNSTKNSKPGKELVSKEFFELQEKHMPAKVMLDDLGSYLKKSKRFCENCLILFPKSCDLKVHREIYHYVQDVKETILKKKSKVFRRKPNVFKQYKNVRIGTGHTTEVIENKASNKINDKISKVKNKSNDASNEKHACFHCNKSFSSQQLLIKHLQNIFHSTIISRKSQEPSNTHMLEQHTNLAPKVEKIYTKLHGVKKVQSKDGDSQSKSKNDVLFYRCHICSYYFRDLKFFLAHLINKHKVKNNYEHLEENKVRYYDPKCRYCSSVLTNMISYNSHLQQSHKQQYTAKQSELNDSQVQTSKLMKPSDVDDYGSFVLKLTLFKCSKCNIHFLSTQMAMNHSDHTEILVNWKCSICLRIFKKNDELLHKRQHLFSDEFIVYELSAVALSRVLYNCPKCTIHFKEEKYLSHYPVCGIETPESVYCNVCDILIDNAIGRSHRLSHSDESLKSVDFTVIASEIISNNAYLENEGTTKDESQLKRISYESNQTLLVESSKDDKQLKRKKDGSLKATLKAADSSKETKQASDLSIDNRVQREDAGKLKLKKRKQKNKSSHEPVPKRKDCMFHLSYCITCKCFLTDNFSRNLHIQSRCGDVVKRICKICGLVLAAKAYQTHKNLHRTFKKLVLQDFRFYEFESKKPICPPIPEFPQCNTCEVHFANKQALLSHECSEDNYLTCHICEIKLSEQAFMLHMLFHNYSVPNRNNRKLCTNSSSK